MTKGEFNIFLFGTIVMCCVMSVVNALRNGHRGWAAYILSVAFLVFAGTVYLYYTAASAILLDASYVLLFLLLVGDFYFRTGKPPSRKRR
jgi:hypothetical protein